MHIAGYRLPAAHGMVAKVWLDREKDRLTYNIEAQCFHPFTAGPDVDQKTEIDPAQGAVRVEFVRRITS